MSITLSIHTALGLAPVLDGVLFNNLRMSLLKPCQTNVNNFFNKQMCINILIILSKYYVHEIKGKVVPVFNWLSTLP
jgi:hypothetical protein